MNNLVWLHEEILRTDHLVFEVAGPNAQAFFVWDEKRFASASINFKRLVFIYETLSKLPVKIYRGETRDVINKLSYKFGITEVFTPGAKSISLQQTFEKLQLIVDLNIIEDTKLFYYNDDVEYTRFFQFWRAIENRDQLVDSPAQIEKQDTTSPRSEKIIKGIHSKNAREMERSITA